MKAVRRWAAEQRLQPLLEVAHNLDDAIKYHADLDRRLDRTITTVPIPGSSPGTEPVRKAAQAHRRQPGGPPVRVRDQSRCSLHQQRLRTEPPTQCGVRKVTNGFRCDWGPRPTPPSAPSSAPQRRAAHPISANFGARGVECRLERNDALVHEPDCRIEELLSSVSRCSGAERVQRS